MSPRARQALLGEIQVGSFEAPQAPAGLHSDQLSGRSLHEGARLDRFELQLQRRHALLNLDLVGRSLAPNFDPNESIRRNSTEIMSQRTMKSFSMAGLSAALMETKELVEKLPTRVNQFLDLVAANKLRINVDAIDEDLLMSGLQKVANRITLGLILAALIIGAALLMRVETNFRIFGYPGLAMLFFLGASIGACLLVFAIVKSDRQPK